PRLALRRATGQECRTPRRRCCWPRSTSPTSSSAPARTRTRPPSMSARVWARCSPCSNRRRPCRPDRPYGMTLEPPIPVLRIFTRWPGSSIWIGWALRSTGSSSQAPAAPTNLQISRGPVVLHLTENYGDCSPGAKVFINTDDVEALHCELHSRPNPNKPRGGGGALEREGHGRHRPLWQPAQLQSAAALLLTFAPPTESTRSIPAPYVNTRARLDLLN